MADPLELVSGIQQAKDAGYTPDEIYGHLAQRPEFAQAKEAGYSFDEVYQHLYSGARKKAVAMSESATGIGTPVGGMLAELSGGLKVDPLTEDMHEFLDTVPPDLEKKMVDTINAHTEEDWKKEVGPVMADQLRQHYAQRAQGVSDADQPLVYLPKPSGDSAAAALTRGVEQSAEGLVTLKNIGILGATVVLPKPLQKVVGAAFLAMMGKGVAEDAATVLDSTKTKSERLEATGRGIAGAAMVGLGVKEFARPSEGGATPAERSGTMTQKQADAATTQNQLRSLAPQTAQTIEPKPQGQPEMLDGLTLARRKVVEGFADAPLEQQKARQQIIDHIDDTLLSHDKDAVRASEARTAQLQPSTPTPESPATEGVQASPQAQGGRSKLFAQAAREAGAPLTAEAIESSPPPQVEPELAPAAGERTVADEKAGPAEVEQLETETFTPVLTPRQIELAGKMVNRSGGTSLTDAEEDEIGKWQEQYPGVSIERAATKQSARQSPMDQLKAPNEDLGEAPHPGEKMVSDLQKLGRVNRDPAKSVASELKYYSDEERQQLQEHLGAEDAEPDTLAKAITGKPKIKETSRPSEYVDEPAGKEGRGHPTADVAKEAFGEDYTGGPGAMGPREAEAMRQAQSYTSNKNADVDAKRVARGLQPMMSAARQALGSVWDEAMKRIDRDPSAGRSLVEEINRKPRAITGVEEATMLHHRIDISNDLENETRIALDPDSTSAEKTEASVRSAALMDHLNEIDNASRSAGTEWGRSGRFRQQLVAEDYSLARMLQKKQLANGGEPLTPEQTADVGAMNKRIADLEQKVKEHEEQAEVQRQAVKDAQADAEIARMAKEQTPAEKYAQGLLDRIQGGLKTEADKARARIRARLGKANALVDPTVLYDVAVIGAEKLFSAGLDFGKWSKSMIEEIGEDVRPHLEELFKTSQKINNDAVDRIAPKEMREKIKAKPKTDAEARENVVAAIKDKVGQKENVGSKIQELALNFVRSGITDREKLVEAVHGAVKEALPDATPRDIRDAISGYGDYKELSKEEAKVTLRDLKGQMQQVSKIEDMTQKGVLPPKTGVERREPSAEERGLAKEVNRIKKELGLNATDPNQLKGALDAVKTRLKNRIEDLQQAIAKKEKLPGKGKSVQDDAEAADLRKQKDAAQKEYDAVFEDPKLTPEQIALKVYKTRTANRIADLRDRLAKGDFKPRERKPIELDAEGQKLKAEAEKAKLEFDRGNAKDRLANRSTTEKVLDTLPKVSRAFLLSNPITLAKLTAAAVWRMAITPIEEVAGAGLAKIPLISDIAERAPREGGGLNVRAESKALTEGFTKGMRDAYETLTKGETSMDVAGGKKNIVPHEWIDFIGGIHGALKSVTKRNEFARSFEKRAQFNMDHGVDVTDPAVQARLAMESYKDAQRSIFQQDNGVVSRYNRFLTSLEEKSKVTGRPSLGLKVLQSGLKTLLPIVKIPTNIVAEAFQYAAGSVTGSARLTQAFRNGIETLKPEEADLIMRELKKGSVGGAVLLLGFLAPQAIGGYYQYGKKRSESDVKPGEIKIHGQEIPGFLLHNPLLEQFQIGSTIRRVADSKLRKRDQGTQGVSAGIFAAALGLTSEVPFVRETTEVAKAFNPYQRGQFVGELAKSRLEPQIIQSIAKWTDKDAQGNLIDRKPDTFAQYMESGIPGLRENVPEKSSGGGYRIRKGK